MMRACHEMTYHTILMKEGMQLTVINLTGYELKKYRTSLHDGRGPLDCGRLRDHVEPNLTDVA